MYTGWIYQNTSGLPDKWSANVFEWFFMFYWKLQFMIFLIKPQLLDGQYGTARNTANNFLFYTHAGILVLPQNYFEFIIQI